MEFSAENFESSEQRKFVKGISASSKLNKVSRPILRCHFSV